MTMLAVLLGGSSWSSYRLLIQLCIYSFLAKQVEDPSNLVMSWTQKRSEFEIFDLCTTISEARHTFLSRGKYQSKATDILIHQRIKARRERIIVSGKNDKLIMVTSSKTMRFHGLLLNIILIYITHDALCADT